MPKFDLYNLELNPTFKYKCINPETFLGIVYCRNHHLCSLSIRKPTWQTDVSIWKRYTVLGVCFGLPRTDDRWKLTYSRSYHWPWLQTRRVEVVLNSCETLVSVLWCFEISGYCKWHSISIFMQWNCSFNHKTRSLLKKCYISSFQGNIFRHVCLEF